MKQIGFTMAIALCVVAGCKKKSNDAKPEAAPAAKPAEPVAKPAEPAAPAAKPVAEPPDTIGSRGKSPTAALQLELPDSWDRIDNDDGGRLETFAAVNDSKFPVDNAQFTFEYGPAPAGTTTDYTTADAWFVVKKIGDTYWQCGGSTYKDADYNKIPKVRDEMIANAKKICASMKI